MTRTHKFFFHLCMFLSVATMVAGHAFIITSGAWFIPGKEKYNIFTRWVSDFAAKSPEGLWIKASIVLFCIALLLFKRARLSSCGVGTLGHARWAWNGLLTFGLIAGLLLVVLYDMSPPQFTRKDPSWLGKVFGQDPEILKRPLDKDGFRREWHHKLGFQMFIFSFATMLITALIEKWRIKDVMGVRRDAAFMFLTALFMLWLLAFHNSLAGIPQRVLLILIFWWVWREGAYLPTHRRSSSLSPNLEGAGTSL
jgi:hypothetical protein